MIPVVRSRVSAKASQFQESVIREMTRLAAQHKAVNLAQGLPDFPCPMELKEAARDAIFADINQYAITWGDKHLRDAIAEKTKTLRGIEVEPETEITVTCGATEAMIATMLALVNPGDEVIVFEPFYENYGPDAIISGATPRYVALQPPDWTFDPEELENAFSNKTRAIIINTPHNPTGKVFTPAEMELIARMCQRWGVLAVTDEMYEHIVYDGREHIAMAAIPGMEDLTVTINSMSKTYSVTGWRVGWAIAPADVTKAIRKVHDFLTVGAPAPLQRASASAIKMGAPYFAQIHDEYVARREQMLAILDQINLPYWKPEGAYYVLSDISELGQGSDIDFSRYLVEKIGVAVVPGSSFFGDSPLKHKYIRFCFSRQKETLDAARERLIKLL